MLKYLKQYKILCAISDSPFTFQGFEIYLANINANNNKSNVRTA